MRKVVVYEFMSLDGVAEAPDDFVTVFDEVMEENLKRVIDAQDTVLLGRRTYDEWADFWPSSDIQPFADFINGVEKFVVTSTAPVTTWANASVIDEDLAGVVTGLKKGAGGDIGVHGSITLCHALFELGLVDQLRLVVAPTVQGRGRTLFERGTAARLTLTRTLTSPSGYLLLDYTVGE